MIEDFAKDVASVQRIEAVPRILDVICHATGMGFALVAAPVFVSALSPSYAVAALLTLTAISNVAALTASLAGSISSRITHPQNRGPGTSETAYFSSLLAVEVAGHHVGDRREHRLVL